MHTIEFFTIETLRTRSLPLEGRMENEVPPSPSTIFQEKSAAAFRLLWTVTTPRRPTHAINLSRCIDRAYISVNCLTRFSSSTWSWMKYDFITRQLQSNRNHFSFGDNMKVMTVVDCVFDTPAENKLWQ